RCCAASWTDSRADISRSTRRSRRTRHRGRSASSSRTARASCPRRRSSSSPTTASRSRSRSAEDDDLGGRYPPYLISVGVPLLNEENSLDELYREIASALEPRGEPFEVVFVDDGSTDGSSTVLGHLHDQHANVVVVRLRRNFGKAAALQ